MLPSDGRGGCRVGGIVPPDLPDGLRRLLDRAHADQPLARRQEALEAGVLDDDRAPCRQVIRGAVAEPAAAGADVPPLGAAELSAGAGHIVAVEAPGRDQGRALQPPGVLARSGPLLPPAVLL